MYPIWYKTVEEIQRSDRNIKRHWYKNTVWTVKEVVSKKILLYSTVKIISKSWNKEWSNILEDVNVCQTVLVVSRRSIKFEKKDEPRSNEKTS